MVNRSVIVLKYKKYKIYLVVDVALPSDRNVKKYKNLTNEEHEIFCHTGNHSSHRNCK